MMKRLELFLAGRALWPAMLASVLTLGGCGSLPDAKPFAEATGVLSASAKASGQAMKDSIQEAAAVQQEDQKAYVALADRFGKAWQPRELALRGATDYADAMVGVVAASEKSAETASKVADSLTGLSTAFGVPLAAPAVATATEIGAFVWKRVSIVRASNSLEQALEEAQPAVDRLAAQLIEDSRRDLNPILIDLRDSVRAGISKPYDTDQNLLQEFEYVQENLRRRALKDDRYIGALQKFDIVKQPLDMRLSERDRKLEQAAVAYRARVQLVNAMALAVQSWADAHRDLARAVKEKRKVSVSELIETAAELRELTKKVRAL